MFIGDNKHVNNIGTKNAGTERQWLLTECEGGSEEVAKVSDVSWTGNQTIIFQVEITISAKCYQGTELISSFLYCISLYVPFRTV